MTRQHIPQSILDAAHLRSAARAAGDWAEADRLRAEIEAAGWKIVDSGTDFALSPAAPPTSRRGRARPLRVERERAVAARRAGDGHGDRRAGRDGLAGRPGPGAGGAAGSRAGRDVGRRRRRRPVRRAGRGASTRSSGGSRRSRSSGRAERLGHGAATNIGLRRAVGPVVVLSRHERRADRRHRDAARPRRSTTRRSRSPAGGASSRRPALVRGRAGRRRRRDRGLLPGVPARRRRGARARSTSGSAFYRNLDIWWSLVLRDEGGGEPPRRAVAARRAAARAARAPRLDEPARRRARPAEQAQLLPDHRPVRLAARPADPRLIRAGGRGADRRERHVARAVGSTSQHLGRRASSRGRRRPPTSRGSARSHRARLGRAPGCPAGRDHRLRRAPPAGRRPRPEVEVQAQHRVRDRARASGARRPTRPASDESRGRQPARCGRSRSSSTGRSRTGRAASRAGRRTAALGRRRGAASASGPPRHRAGG